MWLLDHVHELRASAPKRRMPTIATAYLMEPPADGRAWVRLWDGEPALVPAQPGVYSGIRTVSVQVDQHGRPVLVFGPTTSAPVAAPEPAPTSRPSVPDAPEVKRTVERSKSISPTDSGTHNARFGDWRSWGGSWEGHPYTAAQGSFSSSGTLTGAGFYGLQVKALGADVITSARVRIVSAGQGSGWTPVLRLVSNGSKPSGVPSLVGDSFAGPALGYREAGWVSVPAAQRELLRTGAARGVALVGGTYGATRGKGTSGLSLAITYEVTE